MNKARRKAIDEQIAILNRALEALEEVDINEISSEEQEYLDNMPESLQNSTNGENAQMAIDAFDACGTSIDEAKTAIEAAISSLEEAQA